MPMGETYTIVQTEDDIVNQVETGSKLTLADVKNCTIEKVQVTIEL